MTRKQAVSQAIAILSKDIKNTEIVTKLKEIQFELPITTWTKASIIDAVENYAMEHGNILPYQKELTSKNDLPSATAICGQFGVSSVYGFYDIYFPEYKKFYRTNSPYKEHDSLYFKNVFIDNYNRIKQQIEVRTVKMKTYDDYRDKNTPVARTIVRNCQCETYEELLILCGLKKPQKEIEISLKVSYKDDDNSSKEFQSLVGDILRSKKHIV